MQNPTFNPNLEAEDLLNPGREHFIFTSRSYKSNAEELQYRPEFGRGQAELMHPFPGCAILLCDGFVENPEALSRLSFQTNMSGLTIIVLSEEGEVTLNADGEVFTANHDSAFMVNLNDNYDRTRDIVWQMPRHKYAVFIFEPNTARHELARWGAAPLSFSPSAKTSQRIGEAPGALPVGYRFERDAQLNALSQMVWDRSISRALRLDYIRLKAVELMLLISNRVVEDSDVDPIRLAWIQRRMSMIRTEIDRNIAAPPPLKELARMAGMSRSLLSENFRKSVGVTLNDYIVDRKMVFARSMIENSGMKISEIAKACGYSQASNFSRAFTNHFGVPPKSLRK